MEEAVQMKEAENLYGLGGPTGAEMYGDAGHADLMASQGLPAAQEQNEARQQYYTGPQSSSSLLQKNKVPTAGLNSQKKKVTQNRYD
mmetsp:Transcript_8519/g.13117  ORF Transcript_8519/g.13117 Transcript_8519/m.13117 type:complete len:87 (+) Transcript_8519:1603-1863(+)|eukprot:CAMPEP_0170499154 /NCGR_PEP_ID=MMETSP0208-20121228/30306_1 /TAXON_ID=197538 /ORGANISM="Strombidium inclinatum, Strain S3" /LENGTH=86 /DNA_ID=CAMNT_0010776599 /DNA_START=1532 /DNA_END=1792 /DNA_ORIENTATION=+